MNLKPETFSQIQSMLQADPALLEQVKAHTEPAGASELIARAASAKGIQVAPSDLVAYAEETASNDGALSDAWLEHIAGGCKKVTTERQAAFVFNASIKALERYQKGPNATMEGYELTRKMECEMCPD